MKFGGLFDAAGVVAFNSGMDRFSRAVMGGSSEADFLSRGMIVCLFLVVFSELV